MSYDLGELVRTDAVITDFDGNAVDPTTVMVEFTSPSGVKTSYTYNVDPEVVKDSTGTYHASFEPDESGLWYYRWSGTGAAIGAKEKEFIVKEKKTP